MTHNMPSDCGIIMSHTDYVSRYRYANSFYTPMFAIRGFKLSKYKVKCVGHYLFNKN